MNPRLGLTFALFALFLGSGAACTKVKLKASKNPVTPTAAASPAPVVSSSPSPRNPTAGFAITSGGTMATHPGVRLQGTIGVVGSPIRQGSASAQNSTGLQGVLYEP